MKKLLAFLTLFVCAIVLLGAEKEKKEIPAMPFAVSGNAVATIRNGLEIYSMMGVGPRKTFDDITNQMYVLNLVHPKWTVGHQVPGLVGRVGAAAIGMRDAVFLIGGYMVDGDGKEIDVPDVNVFEPQNRKWFRSKDLPVAVDGAVIGTTHNRYIYLIGGRSSAGPVNIVQVYDAQSDNWTQATPFPGTPVFGLAGGIADEVIVVVDGAKAGPGAGPRYVASDECWLGKIDHKDPNKIEWSKLPAHPGKARFAIASGGSDHEHKIIFSGGTTTPHGYNGLAYDGQPSEVSTLTFGYDVHHRQWETIEKDTPDPRADSRGIVFTAIGPLVLGGLSKDSETTPQVTQVPVK
jgi:N-acetylneuraminic acid mutarotase